MPCLGPCAPFLGPCHALAWPCLGPCAVPRGVGREALTRMVARRVPVGIWSGRTRPGPGRNQGVFARVGRPEGGWVACRDLEARWYQITWEEWEYPSRFLL